MTISPEVNGHRVILKGEAASNLRTSLAVKRYLLRRHPDRMVTKIPRFRFLVAIAWAVVQFGWLLFALLVPTVAAATPQELLNTGHVDELIQTLQIQIAANPQDAESYNFLCRSYFAVEEWDRGIAACEHAVNLDPQNGRYYLWLGRIYGERADRTNFLRASGFAKKVRSSFERAVELNTKDWEARTDLAEFYLEAPGIVGGGKDKARAQAAAIAPLNAAMAHWVLGRIAEKSKDSAAAEREYRAEIAASDGGARGWLDLALFYRHTNRFDEMEQALHTMDTRPLDRAESLMDGASILLRSNRNLPFAMQLVQRYLESPVEAGPAFKAQCLLGELLEKQGNAKAAADQYRAALSLAHNYTRARDALKRLSH
jgi:cytochrome c-type biogenesis protein CcmH/NrfG